MHSARGGWFKWFPHLSVRQGVPKGNGMVLTIGLVSRSMAHGHRPHQNRTRQGETLTRRVRVGGGSPELWRGSVMGANGVIDDGGSPGTGGFSCGGLN